MSRCSYDSGTCEPWLNSTDPTGLDNPVYIGSYVFANVPDSGRVMRCTTIGAVSQCVRFSSFDSQVLSMTEYRGRLVVGLNSGNINDCPIDRIDACRQVDDLENTASATIVASGPSSLWALGNSFDYTIVQGCQPSQEDCWRNFRDGGIFRPSVSLMVPLSYKVQDRELVLIGYKTSGGDYDVGLYLRNDEGGLYQPRWNLGSIPTAGVLFGQYYVVSFYNEAKKQYSLWVLDTFNIFRDGKIFYFDNPTKQQQIWTKPVTVSKGKGNSVIITDTASIVTVCDVMLRVCEKRPSIGTGTCSKIVGDGQKYFFAASYEC
jgi:hypothetical protein